MKRQLLFIFLALSVFYFILIAYSYSEDEQLKVEELKKAAPKVFIDCRRCDMDFIRTEITFVNFVRDRKEADVHVLVTTQRTGSGGQEYTMAFIGRKSYSNLHDTLKYVSHRIDTRDDTRRGIVHVLKLGLIPYVSKTPIATQIAISLEKEVKPTSVEDKWNFWVFSVGLHGRLSGEKKRNFISLNGNLSVNRITPGSKIRMGLSAYFDESNFDVDETKISSSSENEDFSSLFVKSINDHWSAGAWLSFSSSTYRNIKFAVSPMPAIEYNVFPYSESTRRQLRLLYRIGYNFFHYREETIYDKTSENLLKQSLSLTFELKEPWGTASTSLEGSHYFHDFSKNRLELWAWLSLKIFKGLSLSVHGSYSRIHDQLSLPKSGAVLEEILLQRKELATNYDYSVSLGLSYTFGSIYSNVVNPRFGR